MSFAEAEAVSMEESANATSEEVTVRVRAIKGHEPIGTDGDNVKPLKIDKRLADISAKLNGFQFRKFRLISQQELNVPVKKKTAISLTEKTVLNIRPIYVKDQRVGMWIKWTDSSGERTLLDTRMHFNSGETMLAGTNCKDDKALILSISAVPKVPAIK